MHDSHPPVSQTSKIAFISGHIELPLNYFETYYEPQIQTAIASNDSFVMGPIPGVDTLALKYLVANGVEASRITVYLADFEQPLIKDQLQWFRDLGGKFHVEGVRTSDRDAAMTRDSDYDILRYMPVDEQKAFYRDRYFPRVSATEKNERRRLGLPLHVNYTLSTVIAPPGQNKGWKAKLKRTIGFKRK